MWSSWYSWFEEITEHTIETEVPHAQTAGYRVLQIDDGWEKTVGDWQANTDFEHGMDHCATLIHNAGMRPGLWMAPFIARSSAPIVREHPEYFIHNADGTLAHAGYNWGEPYFGLDTTHPGAQQRHETRTRLGIHLLQTRFPQWCRHPRSPLPGL